MSDAESTAALESDAALVAAAAAGLDFPAPPAPEPQHRSTSYGEFGDAYIRRVFHKERMLRMVNRVLGEQITLGPIGAGPGRAVASVSAVGTFRPCKGEEIAGEVLTYRVFLPISVVFDLDMRIDRHRFDADVVVPLTLSIHTEEAVRVRIDIDLPAVDEIALTLQTPTRRGTVLQKLAGLESEIRRFLLTVVRTELAKPYVRRATHLDMEELIDGAWDSITATVLPQKPEDRVLR